MTTEQTATGTEKTTETSATNGNGHDGHSSSVDPAVAALRSQVTTAFGELARVQDEVRRRIEEFGQRETEIAALRVNLEAERKKLGTQAALAERLTRETEQREESLRKREEAVSKREEAARAFRGVLAQMAAVLDDPTREAVAATVAAAKKACAVSQVVEAPSKAKSPSEVPTADAGSPVEDIEGLDLSDFTPDEHQKLRMLRQLGTVKTSSIVEAIRAERAISNGGSKSKRSGKRTWLF
jgi:hypothetical protein